MKRRTFIAKGLGAGMAVTASHSILAGNSWNKTEEVTTEGVRVEEGKVKELPVFWDQLTSPDFREAVTRANGVCVIPIGVIEKHGPHLPLGTDVIRAHEMCERAAKQEYAIVFPDLYVGQIFEAKHQPGTVAYSMRLMLDFLDETCREIARNGLKKIILVNTHGGNNALLSYFLQVQLEAKRDYVTYVFQAHEDEETQQRIKALRKSTTGGHADEIETSEMLVICPEFVRMDQVNTQSGENLRRLDLPNLNTGISWYSQYPNHYAGQSEGATAELGELVLNSRGGQLARAIKNVKADVVTKQLQEEFFQRSGMPLNTEQ